MAEVTRSIPTAAPSAALGPWHRFRRARGAMLGAAVVIALVSFALLAPVLAPFDPDGQDLGNRFARPGFDHLLGTDEFGRDELSRLIYGARPSLGGAAIAVAIGLLGVPLGLLAGYVGRWVDGALSFVNDALMSVPAIILAMALVAVLGPGLTNAMVAVGFILIPRFYRVARGTAMVVRRETFIVASVALGCSTTRTLWRHVFPNICSAVIVQCSVTFGIAVLAESYLSFLGLGVQPPTASWGSMLTAGSANLLRAPLLVYVPGFMITLTVIACSLVGDGLRVAFGTGRDEGAEAI